MNLSDIRKALPQGTAHSFKCKAQRTADPPQDCNWPFCGCDSYADKVLEALQESGLMPSELDREIGNVLDHWEQMPNDLREDPSYEQLHKALERLYKARIAGSPYTAAQEKERGNANEPR